MSMRFAMFVCLGLSGSVLAQTVPEPQGSMTWNVVLVSENPQDFPAEFRSRFCRELRMALETGFEKSLCRVEVSDLSESAPDVIQYQRFRGKEGWAALESNGPRRIDGIKTHYVRLSKSGTMYRLEARQVDGFTGLLSPRLAVRETESIELVSRLAGIMLAPEYGVTGTVIPNPTDPKAARIRLKAGNRPGVEKLVQANDIFAVSTITAGEQIGQTRHEMGQVKPYTYLKALGPVVEGEVRCEVLTSLRNPLEELKGIAGFRAMKLATQTAPLRLSITDKAGKPAPANAPFEIWASDTGFIATPSPRDRFDVQDNMYVSARPLQKIACVVVKFGAARHQLFVIPVGRPNDPPVTLRMRIDPKDIAQAEFDQSCEELTGKIAQAALDNTKLFSDLGQLISDAKNEVAYQKAKDGLKTTAVSEKALSDTLAALRADPLAADEAAGRLLNTCEKQLAQLRADHAELERKTADLKDAVTKANDPVKFEREFRAKELARQIAYHTGRGEIPTAFELYDKLIELTRQADLPAKKSKLEAEWKPVNEAHAIARKVLLDEWRKAASQEDFTPVVPKLKGMIEEFTRHSDKYGLRNFLSSLPTATARLGELVAGLDESVPANREALQLIKQWNEDIRKADEAANASLK